MRNPVVTLIVGLVIGLIIAAGAFFGGMNVGKAQTQDQTQQFFAARGGGTGATGGGAGAGQFGGGNGQFAGRGAGGAAGNFATGTISKIDGKTLTLSVPNQADITVTLVDTATIVKSVVGSPSDLKAGDRIIVTGQRSGNNIAATGVQLNNNPAGAGFFPGGGGRGRAGADMTPTP